MLVNVKSFGMVEVSETVRLVEKNSEILVYSLEDAKAVQNAADEVGIDFIYKKVWAGYVVTEA